MRLYRAALALDAPWPDRASACVAQAQGRFADAAVGAYQGLQCGLARHIGTSEDALALARTPTPPPRFVTTGRIAQAYLLLCAGLPDEAAVHRQQAGAVGSWSWPVFFVVPGYTLAALVAIGLGRPDDLAFVLAELERFRGEHALGSGINYLGPIELTLGLGALTQGRLDAAVGDLSIAAERADRAGAPAFAAEARHHLATVLLARSGPGDRTRAVSYATDSDRLVRALGMAAFTQRSAELLNRLGGRETSSMLSAREAEVAQLVAEGLTNRQIAQRLVISERTGNHVAHILTKLNFTSRSQIAAWSVQAKPR